MKSSSLLFTSTLILGTTITLSSPSWFTAWMGLEVNLLSFIPLMLNSNSTNSAMKYFFMQAIGSMMILFSIITPMLIMNTAPIIIAAIMLKLGGAPFHFWLPPTATEMSPAMTATLLSWQKIAPMALLMITPASKMTMLFIMLSAAIGAWGGMNEMRMKTIMAYASINHMAWILALTQASLSATYTYITMYTMMMFSLFLAMNKTSHLTQMWSNTRSKMNIVFSLSILSLGGLPPLMGFIPKWMAMSQMMIISKTITTFLVITSMIVLYYYIRMTWMASTQSQFTHTYSPHTTTNFWLMVTTTMIATPTTMGWLI